MVAPLFAAVLPALPSIAGSLLNLGKERKATKAARAAEQKRSLQASLQARFKVGELQRSGQSHLLVCLPDLLESFLVRDHLELVRRS